MTDGIWGADYPNPSDFFDVFFRCSSFRLDDPSDTRNGDFFCDPAIDRLMNVADREEASDPALAATTWSAVDRAVTIQAPWVVLETMPWTDFLSTQVANYEYNPATGILLDQLQIRR